MKTIMDGVNEFKGELESGTCYLVINSTGYIQPWCSYYLTELAAPEWRLLCSYGAFNDLVSQLETNFGTSPTIEEYKNMKNEIDWDNAPEGATHYGIETKSHSKGWYKKTECELYFMGPLSTEWRKTISRRRDITPRPQPKLIYTQAMKDNGDPLVVGMKFLHKEKTAIALAVSAELDGCVLFTENGTDIDCCWTNDEWVKPIDTRTDKEKAIDSLNKFNLCMCKGWQEDVIGFIKSGEFHGVKWVGE